MKKIILKVCSIVVFAICTLFAIGHVKAENFVAGDYVSKIYARKDKGDRHMYLRMQWIHRASDGAVVYCLDPWTVLDEKVDYNLTDIHFYNELPKDVMTKVNLIAYYGYGYDNHQADYWYAVTQILIWKTVDPEGDFYFTDRLNGNRIEMYTNEFAELEKLVNNHYVLPSFIGQYQKVSKGKDIELVDTNNVLSEYRIDSPKEIVKEQIDNKLILRSDEVKTVSLNLAKDAKKYSYVPIVYKNENSQDIYYDGDYDSIFTNVMIEFVDGSIILNKKDSNTLDLPTNKFVSLENANYEVYDENNELVGKISTDALGNGKLENLPLGKYTVKETSSSHGYAIDTKSYQVELTSENNNKELTVYEDLKLKKLEIFKTYLDTVTNENKPEENIEFGIYNKLDNTLITTIITDKNGYASIELEYGEYIVRQLTTKDGYTKVEDFEIIVDDNSTDKITKELVNYPYHVNVELPNTSKNEMNLSFITIIFIAGKIYFMVAKKYAKVK